MRRVPVKEGSEKKNIYKYYLKDLVWDEMAIKEMLDKANGKKEDALELDDRYLLQEPGRYPAETGLFPLKKGGLLIASNIPVENADGEMSAWWAAWHSLDSLRYAIWNPQDHYSVEVDAVGRARALDPNVPIMEKLWGATHKVLESLDGEEPMEMQMSFLNPAEVGYDMSKVGTPDCQFILCAKALMNGKIPVFMTEVLKTVNGTHEVEMRFWIGYEIKNGKAKCKIPRFIKVPLDTARKLLYHNYKETLQLDAILPQVYAEEKDNWEVE